MNTEVKLVREVVSTLDDATISRLLFRQAAYDHMTPQFCWYCRQESCVPTCLRAQADMENCRRDPDLMVDEDKMLAWPVGNVREVG